MPRPDSPHTGSYAAAPRRRTSIRRRLLAAFVFLALLMSAALGIVGRLSFDSLATYLLSWHAKPVMEAFIEAEKSAWEAEDNGEGNLYYGEDLAAVMHWRFLVGKQVPYAWRDMPDGLHFINRMEEFILIERRDDVTYVLNGGTGAFLALKQRLNSVLLLCAASGLALAVVLAVVLSRRLAGPLRQLTTVVESRPPERMQAEALEKADGMPPIPLTNLDDEVGVLARAIAAREDALQRFMLRESNFTGDVSHELRTPLTIMQGGLEVLELQLQSLPQAEKFSPVVRRLLRTTERMSNTVRTLLLLARRPEEIEFHIIDCSSLLWGIVREMEADGVLLVASASDAADAYSQAPVAYGDKTTYEPKGPYAAPQAGGAGPEKRRPVDLQANVAAHVLARGHKELAGIVFNNLLDNACQYTENGRAGITLCRGELHVRNCGNIPAGVDVFARGVRGAQKAGSGAGLGLSLALRACERLGWRLDLASDPASGDAVFSVAFPPLAQGVDI